MGNACTRRLALILIIMLLLSLLACDTNNVAEQSGQSKNNILVGFSLATLKEDRWLRDRDIFFAKAKQEGMEVIVSNANNDSKLQYQQVQDMVDRGIDILVIAPHDRNDAARAVTLAQQRGIPIISYDRLVCNANVDVYLSFDNVLVGEIMAERLLKAVPSGGYLIINGSPDDHNSEMFRQGYMNILQPAIDNGQIELLDETWVQNWTRELAFNFAYQMLQKHRNNVKGIIAANDSLAWGAIDAISELGLSGQIEVVGMDADLAACQRIAEGVQLMTVYKPIKSLAEEAVKLCKLLYGKEKVDSKRTIYDGKYDVTYVAVGVVAVTGENLKDTVIQDGFHLEEDVYRKAKMPSE